MPQFIVAIYATIGGFLIVDIGLPIILASVIAAGATFLIVSKISSLLSPSRPSSSALQAQQFTVDSTVAPRMYIYGRVKTSGVLTFIGTSGTNNKYLWVVITLADHQCEEIGDIWLDSIKITSSDIDAGTGLVSGGSPAWNGKLYIWKHLGTSAQTVDTNLDAAFSSLWDSNHKGQGQAYIVVRMERDQDAFPNGNPQNYFALVKGRRLYDPRLDSTNGGSGSHRLTNPSTWAWSTNPALATADYLTGGHAYYDDTVITATARRGMKTATSRIDWAQVSAAATECEDSMSLPGSQTENRYSCNGVVSADLPHSENLARILSSMSGTLVYTGGTFRVFCAQYDSPSLSIGDNDLTGEYQVETSVGDAAVFNAVSAVYFDSTRDYQPVTSYMRTNSSYETADGRREPKSIDLPMVTSEYQAQRLCEIENRVGRSQTVITMMLGLNGFKLKTWDTFSLTLSELSYNAKVFRVTHWELDPSSPQVRVIAREEFSSVYTDLSSGDYGAPTSTGLGNQYELPDAPSNIQTSGLANAILVSWTAAGVAFPGTKYRVQESTSSSMSSPTDVYIGTDLQFTIAKTATTSYYYRVRAEFMGKVSDWNPSTGGTLGKASSAAAGLSASASPGTATASVAGSSATTNSVTVTPTGGTAPYTYAWTFASGGSGITITSNTAASTTFSSTGLAVGETRTGNARCTVTDNVSATYTVDVAVTITRTTFSVSASSVTKAQSGFSSSGTVSTATAPAKSPNTTPSGGTPAYTYAWTRLSTTSGPNPTISNSAVQNPTWSASVSDGTDSVSTWQVVATDSTTATASTTIVVTLVWNNLA